MSLITPINPLGIYRTRKINTPLNLNLNGLNNNIYFNTNELTISGLQGQADLSSQPNYNITLNNLNNDVTINSELQINGLQGNVTI